MLLGGDPQDVSPRKVTVSPRMVSPRRLLVLCKVEGGGGSLAHPKSPV